MRSQYAPFQDWEGLDQADLHYVAAYISHNLGYSVEEGRQLEKAETGYRRLLAPKARWFEHENLKRLRSAGKAGLARVQAAKITAPAEAFYDEQWLLPLSKPIERATNTIGQPGSDQPV